MSTLASVITVLIFGGLVALAVWLLAIRPRLPLKDTIVNLLQLIAVYTFVVGFLSTAGIFEEFESLERELTSQNPLEFLAANFMALAVLFSGLRVALDAITTSSGWRLLLGLPVLLVCEISLFAYGFIHVLVVVPLAYFGYVIASVPIDAILSASGDVSLASSDETLSIVQTVEDNEIALRHFLVALPAFALSLIIKVGPLLRRRRAPSVPPGGPSPN